MNSPETSLIITKIVEFIKIAGKYAADNQSLLTHTSFKEERLGSVVTETDLQISKMFKEFVESNFSSLNHIIIDEESLSSLGENKFSQVEASEYQFVIDPIDGTHTYALGTPDYAISVGILKNAKPWLGAICLPRLAELIYFDGIQVHWLRDIFSETPADTIVTVHELSQLSVIFGNDWFVQINCKYDNNKETVVDFYSGIVHFFYMVTQRARGYYFGSYIWDMAGIWPALSAMGFEFFDYETGKKIDCFSRECFNDKFKIKKLHIVSRAQDYERLKEIADLR